MSNYRSSTFQTPSSSSSEDTCWEQEHNRQHGGKEPQSKEKEAPPNSNAVKRESGRDGRLSRVRSYYQSKSKSPGTEGMPKKTNVGDDEPPIYPHEDYKEPRDDEDGNDDYHDKMIFYIILGYITGILLVLCWYFLHSDRMDSDLSLRWLLIVLLVLFLLVLCYSHTTRCIGALLLPVLAGYRGCLLLMSWAFYLALTGPVMNTIRNIDVLMHSLACGQALLQNALVPMHQIMGEPVYIVEQSVFHCLSQVRKLMEQLDDVLQRLESPIMELFSSYKSCGDWLRHQQQFFDNQMGTPYDRCIGAGSISIQECLSKFRGEKSVCDMEKRFEWFCSNLKDLASFFDPYMQQEEQIAEQMFTRPMASFQKIRSIFEVSITFDHVPEDHIKSSCDVDLELVTQFDLEVKSFMLTFIWLDIVILVLVIDVLLAALYFRINYLGSENFRNIYLTNEFYVYSSQQSSNLGYNILPLRSYEKRKYVEIYSWRRLSVETKISHNSWVFMIITSLQLFTICFVDLSLFWMLAIMSYHSHQTTELQPPNYTKILVEGGGMIGYVIRSFVKAFEPLSKNIFVDIQHCLPLPGPPKYLRYWGITMICLLAWLLFFLEPYILRMRHLIMSRFYPHNARRRAQYLYKTLLRNREIYVLEARCRARSINSYDNVSYQNAILSRLCRNRLCAYTICIICYAKLTKELDIVRCDTPNCRGVFCLNCFMESNFHCILCSPRNTYGDLSTYSEVEDSSDDPESTPFRLHKAHWDTTPQERHKSA